MYIGCQVPHRRYRYSYVCLVSVLLYYFKWRLLLIYCKSFILYLSLIFLITSTLLGLKICILSSKLLSLPVISSVPTSRGCCQLPVHNPKLPCNLLSPFSPSLSNVEQQRPLELLSMFQLPPLHCTGTFFLLYFLIIFPLALTQLPSQHITRPRPRSFK